MFDKNLKKGFDILYSAKKSFYINIMSSVVVIIGVLLGIFYFDNLNKKVIDRLKERDIIILTNQGMLSAKTNPDFKQIAQQFAIVTFNSTLNYDNANPLPQLNFMRIYADPEIFQKYKDMVQESKSYASLEHKLYFARIDTNKPIEIVTLIPGKRYKVSIYGERFIVSKFKSKKQKVKLTLIIEKDPNTGIENIFGIKIKGYYLEIL